VIGWKVRNHVIHRAVWQGDAGALLQGVLALLQHHMLWLSTRGPGLHSGEHISNISPLGALDSIQASTLAIFLHLGPWTPFRRAL
jgi:hypothetical protein